MNKTILPLFTAIILFLPSISEGSDSSDIPVVKLTTKLGVEATVPVSSILVNDLNLKYWIKKGIRGAEHLIVSPTNGVYVALPFQIFQEAKMVDGIHDITLSNGQHLKGKLVCTIESGDEPKRNYDLATATKVSLISLPQNYRTLPADTHKDLWKLQISGSVPLSYSVSNPRFVAFQSSSYINVSDSVKELNSFHLEVGNESISANLADFEKLIFSRLSHKDRSDTTQLTVRSKSGLETTGEPRVSCSTAPCWLLAADVSDGTGIVILLDAPVCSLDKLIK